MPHTSRWRQLVITVAVIFMVAVVGNYLWELAQAPLYRGMESVRKRSQGYPGGTNLAQVVKQADRARIAVGRQSSRLI